VQFAEYVRPGQSHLMQLMRQCGVTHAIVRLPEDGAGSMPVDLAAVAATVEAVRGEGLEVAAIEPVPPMERIKQGLPGREVEVERLHELLHTMQELRVPVLCYNFMAVHGWARTRWAEPGRGGALVTAFDVDDLAEHPSHEPGLSDEQMWDNYRYFLDAVLPVAEETGVRLALHPDDPPLSPFRGVARIMRSPDAVARAMGMSDSPAHGLTFCQGTFATMGEDVPSAIRRFADRIAFVHFRDVRGGPERFVETFHDEGMTDMVAAMQAYVDIGYQGPVRSDHVPTLAGEPNDNPGYEVLGRLFAVGYMRGLHEAVTRAAAPDRSSSA
jgi:mannonate dehydratase